MNRYTCVGLLMAIIATPAGGSRARPNAAFPNLFLWTIANEYETHPDGRYRLDQPDDPDWARQTARFIKQHDPYRHLVTVHPLVSASTRGRAPNDPFDSAWRIVCAGGYFAAGFNGTIGHSDFWNRIDAPNHYTFIVKDEEQRVSWVSCMISLHCCLSGRCSPSME